MRHTLALILLVLSSSIGAMDNQDNEPLLSEQEKLKACKALCVFKYGIANRPDKNDLPREIRDMLVYNYLTQQETVNGQLQYDGPIRLYVALELLDNSAYQNPDSQKKIADAIEVNEHLYLLPHLQESSDHTHKYLSLSKKNLLEFTQKKKVSASTQALLQSIEKKLTEEYEEMETLLNVAAERSREISRFRMFMELLAHFPSDIIMRQGRCDAITTDTRFFHYFCRTVVDRMGFLAESYRNEQEQNNTLREVKKIHYQNVTPVICDLFKKLIEDGKIDVNTKDLTRENTPLHAVVRCETNPKKLNIVIQALLKAKADPTIKNFRGETPLDLCQDESSKKIIRDWIAAQQPDNNSQQQQQQ